MYTMDSGRLKNESGVSQETQIEKSVSPVFGSNLCTKRVAKGFFVSWLS